MIYFRYCLILSLLLLNCLYVAFSETSKRQEMLTRRINNAEKNLFDAAGVLQPGETTMQTMFPAYWIQADNKIRWAEALAESEVTFANDSWHQSLYLWRYFYSGQQATDINVLKLSEIEILATGRNYQHVGLILSRPDAHATISRQPVVSVNTWLSGQDWEVDTRHKTRRLQMNTAKIVGPTRFQVRRTKFKGILFESISFNTFGKVHQFVIRKRIPFSGPEHWDGGDLVIVGEHKRETEEPWFEIYITEDREPDKKIHIRQFNRILKPLDGNDTESQQD